MAWLTTEQIQKKEQLATEMTEAWKRMDLAIEEFKRVVTLAAEFRQDVVDKLQSQYDDLEGVKGEETKLSEVEDLLMYWDNHDMSDAMDIEAPLDPGREFRHLQNESE